MEKIIKTGKRCIGGDSPCYIIAEMSANHAGDLGRALEIIRAARDAGADCIKIQTYTADTITLDCGNEYFQIKEGRWKGESLYSLYSRAGTPWEWHGRLKACAGSLGLDFLSTPFDRTAADFLEELGVELYKIASFEIVDLPLISHVASKGRPVILSTGMATFGEIREAVDTVRLSGNNDICLLKCSSAYPAAMEEMNLRTIGSMRELFHTPVGLSDHSPGSAAAVAAVALGAKVIEKHFCVSRDIETPDSAFSMEYDEFRKMVADIRAAEKALGKVSYEITENERDNRIFRKSIFAVKNIGAGEVLDGGNIRVIRPGHGLEPRYYTKILGGTAAVDILRGTPLRPEMISGYGQAGVGEETAGGPGRRLIRAGRLVLREINEGDEEDIVRWRSQKDISDHMLSGRGPTLDEHREWYRRYTQEGNRLEFVIIRDSDGKKIGTVGLSGIDRANRSAELGILLGEAGERGKGYGSEACRACIRHGFEELGLNKIHLRVLAANGNALRLYEKLGFKTEGLFREEAYRDNGFVDVIRMAVFKNDWILQ